MKKIDKEEEKKYEKNEKDEQEGSEEGEQRPEYNLRDHRAKTFLPDVRVEEGEEGYG